MLRSLDIAAARCPPASLSPPCPARAGMTPQISQFRQDLSRGEQEQLVHSMAAMDGGEAASGGQFFGWGGTEGAPFTFAARGGAAAGPTPQAAASPSQAPQAPAAGTRLQADRAPMPYGGAQPQQAASTQPAAAAKSQRAARQGSAAPKHQPAASTEEPEDRPSVHKTDVISLLSAMAEHHAAEQPEPSQHPLSAYIAQGMKGPDLSIVHECHLADITCAEQDITELRAYVRGMSQRERQAASTARDSLAGGGEQQLRESSLCVPACRRMLRDNFWLLLMAQSACCTWGACMRLGFCRVRAAAAAIKLKCACSTCPC